MIRTIAATLCGLLLLAPPAACQQASDLFAPEAASPRAVTRAEPVRAERQMVIAAHPLAAKAGLAILREGGNAVDATVAVQLVLGLVEPQSSGIGGGAFLLHYDAATGRLTTFDGRETAPAAAGPKLFLNAAGEPMAFFESVVGGRSVGAPGTVRLLHDVHARFGQLAWRRVVEPALSLAREGFPVSERLHALIAAEGERLKTDPEAAAYFFGADGEPLPVGHRLANPAYAETLEAIAQGGADAFYEGEIARAIVAEVRGMKTNPGLLSEDDLGRYAIVEREPVCVAYRTREICGMGPPSSGGLAVGQILKLLEPFDLAELGPFEPEAARLLADASRLAFADRGRYVADSDFVPVPELLEADYLAARARLLDREGALPEEDITPGEPPFDHAMNQGDGASPERPSTTHFSIVDAAGNVVSMTSTIENAFGSRLMTNGFLLNNELTDFSFRTHEDGRPVANRVEPGKRPRSSMAPTIVLEDGRPVLALGSPGGSSIIGYVARALVAILDWGMDVQTAAALPHVLARFGPVELEAGTQAEALAAPLRKMGFAVETEEMISGLHIIAIGRDGGLTGGADPRREGVALGD